MKSQEHQALLLALAWDAQGRWREHPVPDRNHTAMWLLHREPDTSVSPSNGILEVAISARTIPKL